MRPGRALLILALTVAAFAPAPGHPFDQPGCGGEWKESKSCRLIFDGFPVTVFADTETAGGQVRAWITLDGIPEVVLLECEGAGSCEEELRLEGLLEDPWPLPPGYAPPFRCFVEGDGEGLYFCGSGRRAGGSGP